MLWDVGGGELNCSMVVGKQWMEDWWRDRYLASVHLEVYTSV